MVNTKLENQSVKTILAPVEQWITNEELNDTYSSSFWNDVEVEKKEEFWIVDGNYVRCIDYLTRSGLLDEWTAIEKLISDWLLDDSSANVADLAAEIGWTSAFISN